MKKLLVYLPLLLLTLNVSAQQPGQSLSLGGYDWIVTESWPYKALLVEADQQSFYWVSSSSYTTVNNVTLKDVTNDYANIFFIKYDDKGKPTHTNHLTGSSYPVCVYSYQGGLTMLGQGYNNIMSDQSEILLGNADMIEFLATYDAEGKLSGLKKIWNLQFSEYPSSCAILDKRDGSVYVYGDYWAPLEVDGYGIIGEEWLGSYFYVIKYNNRLEREWVFTSGFDRGLNETGNFKNVTVHPAANGEVFAAGLYNAIGSGPIIQGDTLPSVDNDDGTFGVWLDRTGKKRWSRFGTLKGNSWESEIHKGIAMDNGDLVLAGVTVTGYYQLGNMEAMFESGNGYVNHFVYRLGPDGEPKWQSQFETMAMPIEGKKGTQSERTDREFLFDAFDWHKEILYLAGTYSSDSFLIADKSLVKSFPEGAFVSSIDMADGSTNWAYGLSSNFVRLTGFDGDRFGNVSLMGFTAENQHFDAIGPNTVAGKQPLFHLGLDYEGKPLWFDDAYLQENATELRGEDLVVLPNGEVFAAMYQTTGDFIDVADTSIFIDAVYSSWMLGLKSDLQLSGTVLDESGAPVYPGYVKFYHAAVNGEYPSVDSVAIDDGGGFAITDLWPGKITLQVKADAMVYPDAFPTYLGNQISWGDAIFNPYGPKDFDGGLDIVLVEVPKPTPEQGSGTITGNVSYEEDSDLKGTQAKPVKKASVLVAKKPAVKKSITENEIVAYVETDEFGNFIFENIPDGEYLLIIDIAGLDMIETHEVVILRNQIRSGFDYTVSDEGIYTWTGVGISEEHLGSFQVYPNPGNGIIFMQLPVQGDYNVRVFSADGRLVAFESYPSTSGLMSFDLSDHSQGIYIINVDGPGHTARLKYVKR